MGLLSHYLIRKTQSDSHNRTPGIETKQFTVNVEIIILNNKNNYLIYIKEENVL